MSILIKPIITEKATADSEMNNRYTFLVDTTANKVEIKKAVEAAYGVTVDKVRTKTTVRSAKRVTQKPDCNVEKPIAPRKPSSMLLKGKRSIFIIIFNSVTCQLEN